MSNEDLDLFHKILIMLVKFQEYFEVGSSLLLLHFPGPWLSAKEGFEGAEISQAVQLPLLDQWLRRACHSWTGICLIVIIAANIHYV